MDAGSSSKIVDCILGLKEYNERKLNKERNGSFKNSLRSPLVLQSNGRNPNRQLDMFANSENLTPKQNDAQKLEGSLILTFTYIYEIYGSHI